MYQIKQIARKLFVILCIIGLMLTLVQCKPDQQFPEEGFWYCEELQILLCPGMDSAGQYAYAFIDGEKRSCALYTDYGNIYFGIGYMYEVDGTLEYTSLYRGEWISFNDECIVTRDRQTQIEYVFVRVPEQS